MSDIHKALAELVAHIERMQADAERYLEPGNGCGQEWFVSRILWHLDGPDQRKVQAAARAAIAAPQPEPVELTEQDMLDCVRSVGVPAPMGLTRDHGPYEVTKPTWFLVQLTRAIEHAIHTKIRGT